MVRRFKNIKTALFVICFVFLGFAVTCLIVIAIGFGNEICNEKPDFNRYEIFYWLSICSATICLCILPIMSYINSRAENERQLLRYEQDDTTSMLNDFSDLKRTKEYIFVRGVLSSFYDFLGITEYAEKYRDSKNNDEFIDTMDSAINKTLSERAKIKEENFEKELEGCLESVVRFCWHLYDLDNDADSTEDYEKIDVLCNCIDYVCSRLEKIAYLVIDYRVTEEIFVSTIFKQMYDIYSMSVYFLVDLDSYGAYTNLDNVCRINWKSVNDDTDNN